MLWIGKIVVRGAALLVFADCFLRSSLPAATPPRPNILVIMTDDQSHDTVTSQFMPNTKAMLAEQGLIGTNFIMSTPLCCPSRASFLTGQYARNCHVYGNHDKLNQPTVVNLLHDSGYYTGLAGKYLNSWPGNPRPEFDYWAAWINGYLDPELNVGGEFKTFKGYSTYLLRDRALEFLDRVPDNKPFFLIYTPWAPHKPATPAPGDEDLYADLSPWRPLNFNPVAQSDKPEWLRVLPPLDKGKVKRRVDEFRLDQLRCLHSVDISVKDIINKLRDQGKLGSTFIVFYSDNGLFWGEHRLLNKDRVYEEAARGPFLVRYPPLIPQPRQDDHLLGVIDLAPTFCELAGISSTLHFDGRSIVSLLQNPASSWRDGILIEGWPAANNHENDEEPEARQAMDVIEATPLPGDKQHYTALRTSEWVYVETKNDKSELYNLKRDPYELHNLIGDPSVADVVKSLSERLHNGGF